jgi:hypothetical protein
MRLRSLASLRRYGERPCRVFLAKEWPVEIALCSDPHSLFALVPKPGLWRVGVLASAPMAESWVAGSIRACRRRAGSGFGGV